MLGLVLGLDMDGDLHILDRLAQLGFDPVGNSAYTVRFGSVKYVRATRCKSCGVMRLTASR